MSHLLANVLKRLRIKRRLPAGEHALSTASRAILDRDNNVLIDAENLRVTALGYAASVELDFDGNEQQTIALAGDITFTTTNLASGKSKTIKILADGTERTFTFPAWVFVGSVAPTTIAANKTAILTVSAFGATSASCVAAYAVQP